MSGRNKVFFFLGFSAVLCLAIVLRPRYTAPRQANFNLNDYEQTDVIGIDLGNTQSCVGIYKYDKFYIILDDQGRSMTPSYVAFTNEGPLVGFAAKNQAGSNPKNTIYDVRRLIGRKFSDHTLQNDIKRLPYDVVNKNGKPNVKVQLNGAAKFFTPEEISSKILEELKKIAEAYLGRRVKYAVITVPAYFGDEQRQATKDAALLVGLHVLCVLNEPTAAGIAHGIIDFQKHDTSDECNNCHIVIYDLGARNCDLTLEEVFRGAFFEILSIAGDRHLGGEDFDNALLNYVVDQYNNKNNVNIVNDFKAMKVLKYEVKKVEEALLTNPSARIEIQARHKINDFSETVTQAQFQELNKKLFEKTLNLVEQILEEAKLKKSQVDGIILTGSPAHTAKVQPFLEAYFDGKKFYKGISPDQAVVRGAAIQAQKLSSDVVTDVVVTSLGLGIETKGGIFTKLISGRTMIPTRKARTFSTAIDNQSKVVLHIFEGERLMASKNRLLGTLELRGIPPAPRGVPQIDVIFEMDKQAVLTIVARDKGIGTEARLVITDNLDRYSGDQVDGIIMDARSYYADDLFAKELATKEQGVRDEHRFKVIIWGDDDKDNLARGL